MCSDRQSLQSEYFKDANEKTNTDWTEPTKKLYQAIEHRNINTNNIPTSFSKTTALPSNAISGACSSLPTLILLVHFARRRREAPIIMIVQLYPIFVRLRRWVVLVYHRPSESVTSVAVTLVWADGG